MQYCLKRSRSTFQKIFGFLACSTSLLILFLLDHFFPSINTFNISQFGTLPWRIAYVFVGFLTPILSVPAIAFTFQGLILFRDEVRSTELNFQFFWNEHFQNSKSLMIWTIFFNIIFSFILFQVDSFQAAFVTNLLYISYIICLSIFLAGLNLYFDYTDADIISSQNYEQSIGALWAVGAWESYYKVSSQDFLTRMTMLENNKRLKLQLKKLIIICPLSCNVSGSLQDRNENIFHIEDTTLEHDQGANINRQYKNSIYGIYTLPDYYFAAEYASPLHTLFTVKDTMDPQIWRYIRDCFVKNLKDLLKYSHCIVLEYDDEDAAQKVPLHSFLSSSINKHLQESKFIDVIKS